MAERRSPPPQVYVTHNRVQVGGVTVYPNQHNHPFNTPPPPIVNGHPHPPSYQFQFASNSTEIRLDCPARVTSRIERSCQCPGMTVINTVHYNSSGPLQQHAASSSTSHSQVVIHLNPPPPPLPPSSSVPPPNLQLQRPVAETSYGAQACVMICTQQTSSSSLHYYNQAHRY